MKMKISVAMATYNGERFLGAQLASIARQTRLPDEMVVTDDGSTDATMAILEEFAATSPFPVRIYKNTQRLGYGENFIKAASLCAGELIAFSDQDDVWLVDKLSKCLPYFEDKEVVLSVHSGLVVDENLRPLGWSHPNISETKVSFGHDLFQDFPGFALIVRKDLPGFFARTLPTESYHSLKRMPHDTWISLLAKVFGKIAFVKNPLILHRRYVGTVTKLRNFKFADVVKTSRDVSAESYVKLAQWMTGVGFILNQIEVCTEHGMLLRQKGEEYCRRMGTTFSRRARLYARDRNFISRLHAFLGMLIAGCYRSREKGGLGFKALIKDLVRVLNMYYIPLS